MTDKPSTDKSAAPIGDRSSLWRSMADTSSLMAEAWSGSVAPFMLTRASEKAAEVNDLSAAIERLAQGPQLADVWDFDRKLGLAFAAFIDMRTMLPDRPSTPGVVLLDVKSFSVDRDSRGEFPLGLGRQLLASPFRVGERVAVRESTTG